MKFFTPVILILTTAALSLNARADISTIFTQRDVNAGNNFQNPEQSVSFTVPGLFEAVAPNPAVGWEGPNYSLSASASQNTLLTTEQDLLLLTGDLGASTFASATGPMSGATFAESYTQSAIYMTITETAVFSLWGSFSGTGATTDFYGNAVLQGDGEPVTRALVGYFQNGTSDLPAAPVTGVLEPGTYIFQLALWSNSSVLTIEDGEVLTESSSVSVNNFTFEVRTVPEPSSGAVACLGTALLGLRRRRRIR